MLEKNVCKSTLDISYYVALVTGRKEGTVIFNDVLNIFYLRLYGVRHMVKDHSDNERGNPLPISSKGSFTSIIPQTE